MNDNVTQLPVAPTEKVRTITLTNRAPIRIVESEWPVIAQGCCGDGSDFAPYEWSIEFRVRRGKSHDLIIHANYKYRDDDQHYQAVRVGRKITAHNAAMGLYQHMLEVGEELRSRIKLEAMKKEVVYALDACFADFEPQSY